MELLLRKQVPLLNGFDEVNSCLDYQEKVIFKDLTFDLCWWIETIMS